jgi:glycosyltransferase involved in cell wall biosynthesis
LIRRIGALARDLYKNPVDLVIMPGYHRAEYWAMLVVCILLRRKRAVFCDSTLVDRQRAAWREWAKRWFFVWCNGFFCYGIRSKEYLMSYGVSESKIAYRCQAAALPHGYGVDKVLLHYQSNWHGQPDEPRFLYVGRLSIEKGLDDLFAAFCVLYKRFPRARLDLVGAGPLADELKRRVTKLNMAHAICFLGSKGLEEIAVLFQASTALVLPSHSEPWGLVVNEALSYGCPVVVSSACGCVPDLVREGITGYAFEAGNVDDLVKAMDSVRHLSNDRQAAAQRCLEVVSDYTPERAATQILDGCVRMIGNTG